MSTPQTPTTSVRERSWHPLSGRSGLTKRRRKLLLLGAITAGFVLLFVWLLRRPMLEPQVHLIGLESPGEQFDSRWTVGAHEPTLYSQNLWSRLEELRDRLSVKESPKENRDSKLFLPAPPDAHQFLQQLRTVSQSPSDLLVLFLNTQAVNRDGKTLFGWDGPAEAENRWWDAQQLLEALQAHPAALKFVVLDAGQTQWAPQQGIVINDFLSALKSQLHETRDPSLWVLCSHSTGEISHLDHKHRNSLFNIAVLQGMRGAADFDENGLISIREITQYTVWKVDFWSRHSAGYEFRQTPQILWGGGELDIDSHWPDLNPVAEESAEKEASPAAEDPEAAPEDSQTQSVASVLSSEAGRLVHHSLATFTPRIRSRLTPAGRIGLPGLMLLWQAAPDATVSAEESPEPSAMPSDLPPDSRLDSAREGTVPDSPPTPAGSSESSETAPAGESDDSEEELSEFEKALLEAWKVRDRLRNPEGKLWPVANRFPLELRRLEQELIRLELLARDSRGNNQAGWNRQLARIVLRFQGMEEELKRPIPLPRDSDPVSRLMREQPFHSVALNKLLSQETDSDVQQIERTLNELLVAFEQEDRAAARQLSDSLEPNRQLIEVELACRLADLPESVAGSLKATVLQNRMRLEEQAARAFGYQAWIADRFRSAELSLSRSESLLLNRIPGTFETEAQRLHERITFDIDGIASDLTTVIAADRLTADLLSRLNEYIQLSRLSRDTEAGMSPTPGELEELIGLLSESEQRFKTPDPRQIPQLARVFRKLRDKDRLIRNRLGESVRQLTQASGPDQSELAWRREVLLRVSLVTAPQRRSLRTALEAASVTELDTTVAELPSLAGLVTPPLSPRNIEGLNSHIGLQARLAQLALAPASPSDSKLRSLRQLSRLDPNSEDEVLLSRCAEFALRLEGLYASATERMSGELPLSLTALKAGQTSARLRGWSTFSRLLSPAVSGRQFELEPSALLLSAQLHELLAWQVGRIERHRSAYDEFYADQLLSADRRYRRALRLIWPAIPQPENAAPAMELMGPDTLSLSESELPAIRLVCKNHLDQKLRGVLVLERDRQTIDARFDPPGNEATVSAAEAGMTVATLFPEDSEFLNLELEPHASRTVEVQLSWRNRQSRLSPIAFTLIGEYEHPEDDSRITVHARETVRLQRPFSDSWVLSFREGIGTTGEPSRGNGPILHPFPNRETEYAFQLDYLGDRQVSVDVELLERRREQLGRHDFLLRDPGLAFSVLSPSAPLNWSSSLVEGRTNGDTEEQPETAMSVSRPIGRSLILRVSDRNSDRVALIPVRIQTQRPRRYLSVSVSYDSVRELIRVILEPRPGIPLPAREIPIVCQLEAEPGTQAKPVTVSENLSPVNPKLDLTIPLGAAIDSKRRLSISADGIAREFVFDVPTDQTVSDLPERLDRSRLEIVFPGQGAAFALEGPPLAANLEIDLPVADLFLERERPVAEVWLDSVPNRQIDSSESVARIDSDRRIELELREPDENGRFQIVTDVSDWEVLLPRAGLPEGERELMGTLHTSRGTESANPVTVILDGTAPILKLSAPDYIVEQEPFPVTLVSARPDSSGVSRVEAQVDLQGDGRFTPEGTIYKGVRTDQSGQWRCVIPTAELTPGRYTVLLRAHDAVGNASEIYSQPMNIVSTEQQKLLERGESVPLTGVVVFGKDAVPAATVTLSRGTPESPQEPGTDTAEGSETTLTVTTDKAGRFRFESVAAGEWTLTASKLLLNRLRTYEATIQVEPPPAPAGIMRIRIR